MALYTYDPGEVNLIVKGVPISGYVDGTFINVNRASDAYSKVVGVDGETTRSKSKDKSGELTINLAQSSASNDVLTAYAILDEASNSGVVEILVEDGLGRSLYESSAAWIRKMPESPFDKAVQGRTWVLDCADLAYFVGGNERQG